MTPYYDDEHVTLFHGDVRDVLLRFADASVHAVVTDPPYEWSFMGSSWDRSGVAYDVQMWRQVARVLKPGGHVVAFGASRTYHRLAAAVEDAGFEIRDSLHWTFGGGFPKSLGVAREIDRILGEEPTVVGHTTAGGSSLHRITRVKQGYRANLTNVTPDHIRVTRGSSQQAQQWDGWGTALRPSHELAVLARKPLEGTVAENVIAHHAGALNIDAARIEGHWTTWRRSDGTVNFGAGKSSPNPMDRANGDGRVRHHADEHPAGRWPANAVFVHSGDCGEECATDCPVAEIDRQSGVLTSGANPTRRSADKFRNTYGTFASQTACTPARGADTGGASRFFPTFRYEQADFFPFLYAAKAPASERPKLPGVVHPTVKPLAAMRWLLTLVTPPGGVVLDPFIGSGTTAQAGRDLGFHVIGIDQHEPYLRLTLERLKQGVLRVAAADEPTDLLDVPAGSDTQGALFGEVR